MRKNIAILFVLIVLSTNNYTHAINGYILLKTGEKIDVEIRISSTYMGTNFEALTKGVKYYDKDGGRKYLELEFVKELYFKIDTNEYKMVCFKNTMKVRDENFIVKPYIMLYEVQKGTLSNYSINRPIKIENDDPLRFLYQTNLSGRFVNVLQIEGKQPIKVSNLKFRKPLLKYIATCKEVTSKIEKGEYGKYDLTKIVNEYNEVCK